MLTDRMQFCMEVLNQHGSSEQDAEELLLYNQRSFAPLPLEVAQYGVHAAIAPEPHIEAWQGYEQEASTLGVAEGLKQHLIQLQFPIQKGMSQTPAYQAATRRGIVPDPVLDPLHPWGCSFEAADRLSLQIYPSLAGPIPVITVECRADFVTLVQALTRRNEPEPIPSSMGACMVSGYNNWSRIRQYRHQWTEHWVEQRGQPPEEYDWSVEFKDLMVHKERYQDRFILLSSGAYSHVAAAELGLTDAEWATYSNQIRLEHECTHYFTRRVLKSMQNHVLDELIADYQGIVAAIGVYRADWFLRFMGLEAYPIYRQGGRLDQYRGTPNLSDSAFQGLQMLVKQAAENLERFDHWVRASCPLRMAGPVVLIALTQLTLIELAGESGAERIAAAVDRVEARMGKREVMAYGSAERRCL